jgi:hypothetical protein
MAKAEKISAKECAKNPDGKGPSAQEVYDKVRPSTFHLPS